MRKMFATLFAAAAMTAGVAQAEVATYAMDPTHTFVTFEIGHFGTSTNRARFDKKEGNVVMEDGKSVKIDLTIDMASVSSGTAAFDKHLRSADIFNVEKFPTATFVADKATFSGEKITEVTGQLTLVGKTQPVTLKANNYGCYLNPMLGRKICGGDFEATIDRTAFGVDYGVVWGFPKNVRLVVQVEAIKQ
jgi:polyisoprenoid-binding protein YceI